MLQNFSRKFVEHKSWMAILLPLWVLASFVIAQIVVIFVVRALGYLSVPLSEVNQSVLSTSISAVIYLLTIVMVIGVPWWVKKYKTTKKEVGLSDWPGWLDMLLAPLGFIVYVIFSAVLILIATKTLTFIDFDQVQDTGFDKLYAPFEYILAFLTLVVIAPVCEEILFRGYLLGKLRKHAPLWVAILITSLLFAFIHFAWNVGIDVFALSIVLCILRVVSKSLWPSILLHMLKNFIAFYLLFINPTLLSTLGG